jgi:hypothetical protein
VAKEAELSYLIAVMVDSSLPRGAKLSNEASVSAIEVDPDPSNQTDQVIVTVNVSPDPFPWQNVVNRFDVNNDTFVVPFDVLLIVNELNSPRFSDAQRMLPVPPPPGVIPFLDVTGDNFVVPSDALNIINFLNSLAGEGEAASGLAAAGVPSPTLIWPGAAATPAVQQDAAIAARHPDATNTLGADQLWAALASPDAVSRKAAGGEADVSATWTELEQTLDELVEDVASWWMEI